LGAQWNAFFAIYFKKYIFATVAAGFGDFLADFIWELALGDMSQSLMVGF
jgi:hypothetical protein